jgi:histidine transport system ATP-binding protein
MDKLLVEDLHKRFGANEVLRGVSLRAATGDVISIIGSSGSGKSTLLRCINLLESPDAGRIVLTKTIRVGSGGVMLPNHSPLAIAEQFCTLAV